MAPRITIVIRALTNKYSILLPNLPNTALPLVETGLSLMVLIAEVSSIKVELVCADNCETCTSGAAADC